MAPTPKQDMGTGSIRKLMFQMALPAVVGQVINLLYNVVDRIFEFDGNGHLQQYEGGYTDYIEAKQRRFGETEAIGSVSKKAADDGVKKASNKDWKQNRPTKLKFTYKEQKEFETIDDDIAALEDKIEKLDADMMANATNSGKLNDLSKEKQEAEAKLEEKMDRWVYLNDLAERIEKGENA